MWRHGLWPSPDCRGRAGGPWPQHTVSGGLTSGMGSERRLQSFSCALSLTPHHLAESKFCQMRPRQMATHWRSSGWGSLSCSRQMAIKFPWRQASCEKADNSQRSPPSWSRGGVPAGVTALLLVARGNAHIATYVQFSSFQIPPISTYLQTAGYTKAPAPCPREPPSEGDCFTDI